MKQPCKIIFKLISRDGSTPLHTAVKAGVIDIVDYLIQKGSNINKADMYDF